MKAFTELCDQYLHKEIKIKIITIIYWPFKGIGIKTLNVFQCITFAGKCTLERKQELFCWLGKSTKKKRKEIIIKPNVSS